MASPTVNPRPRFSSRLATVLTMVGVAVGLGNVWRFPYMMGRFGGSAFLLVYLAFVILFATPALMGEWALGRATRRGPLGALTHALGPAGRWLGSLILVGILVATSYYLVVVGHVAYSAAFSLMRGFSSATFSPHERGLENGLLQAGIDLALLTSALFVLHLGLRRGIERVSKLFVPFFGVVVVYLITSSLSLPGALDQLWRFLRPELSSLTGTSLFAAMGQAFFSLGLGGTFYIIYGSYLRDTERLPSSATATALGDVAAALLAALFIVPTTLIFGLDLEAGPPLIFSTLPRLFAEMAGGRLLGSLFLLALTMVAYLSVVAALQVLASALVDSLGFSKRNALLLVGVAEAVLVFPIAFRPQVIAHLDLIFGSGMQCVGSGIALIALAWGLGRSTTVGQVFGRRGGFWPSTYYVWIRWVVPLALLVTLLLFIAESL